MARRAVTVSGLPGLRRRLGRLAGDMERGADDGRAEAAEAVADDWADEVPVDTGEYQRSIDWDEDGAYATADHAPFVEFGTSASPAQPVAAAAAERGRRRMPGQVAGAVRRRIL